MIAVVQKVKKAVLYSEGSRFSEIGVGSLVMLGVSVNDTLEKVEKLAEKIYKLRIFDDENGKTNKSVSDIGGSIMVVSNFTLYGDMYGSNRPSFIHSAKPEQAEEVYNKFVNHLKSLIDTKTGVFRTHMNIETELDGPGTYVIDSDKF